MASWNPRANELFLHALEIGGSEERQAYLDVACGTDAELRRAVENLLHANSAAGSLLERPAAQPQATGAYATSATSAAEEPGTLVGGRYKLLQEIGQGGMGVVWMAEQTEPVRRMVALKVIRAGMDSSQVIARFEAERQALALMDHPNIAKVLDAGTTGAGRPYFVMELVKGVAITTYCDERRLSPRQRLELFIPVCQAVQHAHTKGVIHRDLKPSNVLVALYDGTPVPKVIDFGVAKATGPQLTERTLFTGFGAIVGTLEYMSPEQAELNQLDIDTRSDIYSLGVLLYELLTGSTPLERKQLKEGAILEVLRLIREQESPRPSTRLSSSATLPALSSQRSTEPAKLARMVRGELDWIVMKCLEKDRNRRYETASTLALDLRRYLADEPVQAGPPSRSYRMRKFVRRHRGPVLAGSAVVLALLAGAVGTAVGLVRAMKAEQAALAARDEEARQRRAAVEGEAQAREARADAETLAHKEKDARHQAEENEKEARHQALRAETARHAIQIDAAFRAWERFDVKEAERVLAGIAEPFGQTWETRHLRDLCRRSALPLVGHPDRVTCVAYAMDGKQVVTGGSQGHVMVWDVATGEVRRILKGPGTEVFAVTFMADGQSVAAAATDNRVRVWEVGTGKEISSFQATGAAPNFGRFSFDGRRLILGAVPNNLPNEMKVWDVLTGQEQFALKGVITSAAFSSDGKSLVTGGLKDVRVRDTRSGKELFTFEVATQTVFSVAISPDKQHIATGSHENVSVWEATTGKQLLTLRGRDPEHSFHAVNFSPDGKQIAAGGIIGKVRVWDATTGQELMARRRHGTEVWSIAFSPDSKRLVALDNDGAGQQGQATVWEIEPHQERFTLPSATGWGLVAMSRDGKYLASGGVGDGTVQVWDAATGNLTQKLRGHGNHIRGLDFSPDSSRLLVTSDDNWLRIWEVSSGQELRKVAGAPGFFRALFSPDGKHIAAAVENGPHTILVLDAQTGQQKVTLSGHQDIILCLAYSADGQRLVSGDRAGTGRVWEATTGKELLSFQERSIVSVAFSPDGRRIASGEYDNNLKSNLKVRDAFTGKEVFGLVGHLGQTAAVVFSPDGQRIASANDDGTMKLWDAATGQIMLTLKGHRGTVMSLAFGGDGRRLVTAGAERLLRMWQAP